MTDAIFVLAAQSACILFATLHTHNIVRHRRVAANFTSLCLGLLYVCTIPIVATGQPLTAAAHVIGGLIGLNLAMSHARGELTPTLPRVQVANEHLL